MDIERSPSNEQRPADPAKSLASLVLAATSNNEVFCLPESLAHLDAMIMDVELAQPPLSDATPSILASIKRYRNSRLPAVKLPNEIFVRILRMFLEKVNFGWDERYAAARISSRYWEVMRDTPALWNLVRGEDPPELVEIALQRSGRVPLDIYVTADSFEGAVEPIVPHVHRCRILHVDEEFYRPVLGASTSGRLDLPLLRTLQLTAQWHTGFTFQLPHAPLLHSVRLDGIKTTWDRSAFRSLTSLLLKVVSLPSLSALDIVHVIRSSAQLEELVLDVAQSEEYSGGHVPEERLLCSALTRLELRHNKMRFLPELLSHLHVPSLETFRVAVSESVLDPTIESLLSELIDNGDTGGTSLAATVLRRLEAVHIDVLEIGGGRFVLRGYEGHLEEGDDDDSDDDSSMSEPPLEEPSVTITLIGWEDLSVHVLGSFLRLIKCPTTLKITSYQPMVLQNLTALTLIRLERPSVEELRETTRLTPVHIPIDCGSFPDQEALLLEVAMEITEATGRSIRVFILPFVRAAMKNPWLP